VYEVVYVDFREDNTKIYEATFQLLGVEESGIWQMTNTYIQGLMIRKDIGAQGRDIAMGPA
jgi:hypothetical protein